MINYRLFISLVFLLISLPQPVWATDWPTFNLLEADSSNAPKSQTIKVSHDPVYKTAKEYQAYPLTEILNKITVPDSLKTDELVIVFTSKKGKRPLFLNDIGSVPFSYSFRDRETMSCRSRKPAASSISRTGPPS